MVILEQKMSVEQFREWANLPENADREFELIDGEIVEMPAPSSPHSVIATRISTFMNIHVMEKGMGYVTTEGGGYRLGGKTERKPDVGFISKEKYATLPQRFEAAPDLAVEVISPKEDAIREALDYLRAGTQIVWLVYIQEQEVIVCTLEPNSELDTTIKSVDDTLDGGDVLPGFTLAVRDLFPEA